LLGEKIKKIMKMFSNNMICKWIFLSLLISIALSQNCFSKNKKSGLQGLAIIVDAYIYEVYVDGVNVTPLMMGNSSGIGGVRDLITNITSNSRIAIKTANGANLAYLMTEIRTEKGLYSTSSDGW
jgi:hypothetical protein